MNDKLRRFRSVEFRTDDRGDDVPAIEGYAAVFDDKTDMWLFTESIARGAFAESLERGDDVRALFNHNPSMVLGRSKAGTVELKEDDKGLWTKIYPPKTELGRSVVELIKRGDISQMSFGFFVDEEAVDYKDGQKPHVTIRKATLFDVSPVTFPAYENTEIALARAHESKEQQQARLERLAQARRDPHAELALRQRCIKLKKLRLCTVAD